jgi:hypothetical protein
MMCNPGAKAGVTVKDGRFANVWPANEAVAHAWKHCIADKGDPRHDAATPVQPLSAMTFTDMHAPEGSPHTYRVIAVKTVGLESRERGCITAATRAPPAGWARRRRPAA